MTVPFANNPAFTFSMSAIGMLGVVDIVGLLLKCQTTQTTRRISGEYRKRMRQTGM